MKSYDEHLKSLLSQKPTSKCQRASALFPIFFDSQCQTRLIFLNYWALKRKIEHLLCRLKIRDLKGNTVIKKCFYVDELKAYEINLNTFIPFRTPFGGSIEIEFSSPENLVFPFPAVSICYQGKNFSSFVHASQRSYNDEEDQKTNHRSYAVESGFNIYADQNTYPFITYINGEKALEKENLLLAAYNQEQKVIGASIPLNLKPYETTYIHLDHWKELKTHLNKKPGCLKVQLNNPHVFPRLIVGNREKKTRAMSVTHSYYDCVKKKSEKDFWSAPDSSWDPAALMLVHPPKKTFEANVFFYPIYSPTPFFCDLEVYSLEGTLLESFPKAYESKNEPSFEKLALLPFIKDLNEDGTYLIRLVAKSIKNDCIPARIKIGYDVSFKDHGLACNICTNFYPANASLLLKKKAFKWAPLFPKSLGGKLYVLNDAPLKDYTQKAKVELTLYREKDTEVLKKSLTLPPRAGFCLEADKEIEGFLENQIGWCTFKSSNPFITLYTFSFHPSKNVGGDHGF